jgi:hypothetical protein
MCYGYNLAGHDTSRPLLFIVAESDKAANNIFYSRLITWRAGPACLVWPVAMAAANALFDIFMGCFMGDTADESLANDTFRRADAAPTADMLAKRRDFTGIFASRSVRALFNAAARGDIAYYRLAA